MAHTVFIALGILGIDFMIYVLFQWTYGDRRRAITRKIASLRNDPHLPRPFLVTAVKTPAAGSVQRPSSA
jgi:hypothetical protein